MKKNLLLSALFAALIAPAAYAIPIHNISLNLGGVFPGQTEIADFYNVTSIGDSPKAYLLGLGYDFAPVEFVSIGAGCNFLLRPFTADRGTGPIFTDTFNLNAVEPFGQVRFYIPIPAIEGFDVFAGGGAGYAVLMGASFQNGQSLVTTAINGGTVTYKFGGGIAYNQGIFTAILDIGYKSAIITPSPVIPSPSGGSNLTVNLGGLYITMSAALSFGNHKEAKNDGEIKKQLENEVNNLDYSPTQENGREEKTGNNDPPVSGEAVAVETAEKSADTGAAAVPEAESTAPEPAATAEPVKAEAAAEMPKEQVQVDRNADDTEGIIILSPGESDQSELEKYITNKSKQFKPVAEEAEGQQDSGEDLVFNYGADEGIIVVESQTKGTIDRAGYVLVEKGGFISSNFAQDGFIYSLDEHKELLSAGDVAYIKLTTGIGAPTGKQFSIYDDSEDVTDPATGDSMGKMIKFHGVAKVTGPIEDNIFKVQIVKSYDPILGNYKIKARQDLKKYHKDINLKVRKKNIEVRASIVKVKDDVQNLKNRDLVYLDAGIIKGLLPGEKMGIYRQTTDADSGKQSEYDRLGTLIIINSMQASSVGLIVKNNGAIKVGDIVKTLGK